MESNALYYFCDTFCHMSWASLFVFNNKQKSNILTTEKAIASKVKWISLGLKVVPLYLTHKLSQHGTEESRVN